MQPGVAGNGQRRQQTSWRLRRGLTSGTDGAGGHKGIGVAGHGGPPEAFDEIKSAVESRVAI